MNQQTETKDKMKIRNSTDWPDYMLRRMTSWCCSQLPLPASKITIATFRNRRTSAWSGHACPWNGRIVVSVGPDGLFPRSCFTHEPGEHFADRMECLVAVTAHECFHVAAECRESEHYQRTRGYGSGRGSSESVTCREEMRILRLFRASRDALISEWTIAPQRQEQSLPIQVKRMNKACDDLALWTRKLKLAQTKVRKLKTRVAYYARQKT